MKRRREPPSTPPASSPGPYQLGYQFEASLEAGRRRASGSYYTPLPVIRYIVEQTLSPIVRGGNREGKLRNVPLTREEILDVMVLDPGMGAGLFLVAAAEYLAGCYWKAGGNSDGAKALIASRCVFGVDIDPAAVEAAKHLLTLYSSHGAGGPSCSTDHLRPGDALVAVGFPGMNAAHPVFNWDREFPGVKFDAVIGNPPYVSYGLRGAQTMDPGLRSYYLSAFPESAQYKISVYALFIERVMGLLKPAGRLGFVLPDSFLVGRYFSGLRQKTLKEGACLRRLVLFEKSFWKDGEVGRPVILVAQKGARGAREKIALVRARDLNSLGEKRDLLSYQVPAGFYRKTPLSRFYFFGSKNDLGVFRHVTEEAVPLRRLVKFYSGLIGKRGRNSIVFEDHSPKRPGFPRSRLIESGRLLKPFSIAWNSRYILHDPALYKSGYRPAFYENLKIILNQTGFSLKACVDSEGYYCLNNLHIGYAVGHPAALHLVAGILNSPFGQAFYSFLAMESGRAMAQIDIDVLDGFPMPRASAILCGKDPTALRGLDPVVSDIIKISRRLHEIAREIPGSTDRNLMRRLGRLVLRAYGIDEKTFLEFDEGRRFASLP